MPRPWIRGVQQTGKLTVFPGPGFLRAPAWGDALFTQILDEFNRLSQANRFDVRLVRGNAAPDGKGGGANVQVEISNGAHTILDGQSTSQRGTLNVSPGRIRGITHAITFGAGASEKIAWAFVFVPANPVLGAHRYTQVSRSPSFRQGLPESKIHGCIGARHPWHWIPASRRV